MSFFLVKNIIGILFLIAGIVAVVTMLTIMGKQEHKIPAPKLRKFHKTAGRVFFVLMLVNAVLGIKYWGEAGDQLSTRGVLHAILAIGLVIILLLKISIIKIFKNFLRMAPTLGMIIFCMAFVVYFISGGFYLVRSIPAQPATAEGSGQPSSLAEGNAEGGAAVFLQYCSTCHYADKEDYLSGPGLANLLKHDILPVSERPATLENIKSQILNPFRIMPAFTNLSEQDMADLLAYIKTL